MSEDTTTLAIGDVTIGQATLYKLQALHAKLELLHAQAENCNLVIDMKVRERNALKKSYVDLDGTFMKELDDLCLFNFGLMWQDVAATHRYDIENGAFIPHPPQE